MIDKIDGYHDLSDLFASRLSDDDVAKRLPKIDKICSERMFLMFFEVSFF